MDRFIPRYKLMLCYNINRETHDNYYQFIVNEMIPGMQGLGLHMFRVYHTAFGDRPTRQVEFLAEDYDTVLRAMDSAVWKRIENKLTGFVTEYSRKVVSFRDGFQL
jgi:hypothetical protein